jgi:DNA ligase-associated metallophosphoesterase
MLSTEVADEEVLLLADKALWWPRAATLVVADVHFGKAASFRQRGIPIPAGTTGTDLMRLTQLIETHRPDRLLVLGDLIHAKSGRAEHLLAEVAQWRGEHAQLQVCVVRGNHDVHAGDPPDQWQMQVVEHALIEPPFVFQHEPIADDRGYVLAGHIHPSVVLHGTAGDWLRAPCFVLGEKVGILPAFGRFTGTHSISPEPSDRVFVVGPDEVVAV